MLSTLNSRICITSLQKENSILSYLAMTKNWLFWSPFGLWWSNLPPVKLFPWKAMLHVSTYSMYITIYSQVGSRCKSFRFCFSLTWVLFQINFGTNRTLMLLVSQDLQGSFLVDPVLDRFFRSFRPTDNRCH